MERRFDVHARLNGRPFVVALAAAAPRQACELVESLENLGHDVRVFEAGERVSALTVLRIAIG